MVAKFNYKKNILASKARIRWWGSPGLFYARDKLKTQTVDNYLFL